MKRHEIRESVELENQGMKLFGIFHRTLLPGKRPTVMIFHGLAGSKSGRFRVYVNLAVALAALGINVFRLDFRGNGDSEEEFSEMTLSGQISDAKKGLEWLCKNPYVDTDKIGFMGRSFGGAVAVLATDTFPPIQSLALWSPVFSGDQWREKWDRVSQHIASEEEAIVLRTINGQVAGLPFYAELFTMNVGERLKRLSSVPLLHIHGEKDTLVDLSHQKAYVETRQESSALTKFILLEGADHDYSEVSQMKKAIDETVHWFHSTLGKVDEKPA